MMTLHHIGCLTEDIEASVLTYQGIGSGSVSPVYTIKEQEVKVCFVEQAPGVFLEFVEPAEGNLSLIRMLRQNKHFYHLGYTCTDFDRSLAKLTEGDHHLINTFNSEAFQNRRCAFLMNRDGHLIELIESS